MLLVHMHAHVLWVPTYCTVWICLVYIVPRKWFSDLCCLWDKCHVLIHCILPHDLLCSTLHSAMTTCVPVRHTLQNTSVPVIMSIVIAITVGPIQIYKTLSVLYLYIDASSSVIRVLQNSQHCVLECEQPHCLRTQCTYYHSTRAQWRSADFATTSI